VNLYHFYRQHTGGTRIIMKNTTIRKALVSAALMFAVAGQESVLAHNLPTGSQLATAIGATDLWEVVCFDDGNGTPDHLAASIIGQSAATSPALNLQIRAQTPKVAGQIVKSIRDPKNGDGAFSPEISVRGGDGQYWMQIDKVNAGVDKYNVSFHCQTAAPNNDHTGTSFYKRQTAQ